MSRGPNFNDLVKAVTPSNRGAAFDDDVASKAAQFLKIAASEHVRRILEELDHASPDALHLPRRDDARISKPCNQRQAHFARGDIHSASCFAVLT